MTSIPSISRVLSGVVISSSIVGIDSLKPVVAIYQQHALVYCSVQERGKSSVHGESTRALLTEKSCIVIMIVLIFVVFVMIKVLL
jgi:hypothetical protein